MDENGDITIDLKYEENKEYSIYVPNVFNELDDGTIGIKSSILAVGGGAAGTKYDKIEVQNTTDFCTWIFL